MTDTQPFDVRHVRQDGALIIDVTGEVDMATAPDLETAISAADQTVERVIVNLTQVSFLDSSGVNALVRCKRELEERAIAVRVVSPTDDNVRRVFEITQLIESLNVVDSVAAALA